MRSSTLLSLVIGMQANAQMWCPPGAQWNYSIGGLGLSGYIVRTYEGDVPFQGLNAQRIHETGYQVFDWLPPDQATMAIDRYAYTAVVDSTLLIWGGMVEPTGWDTLFRFSALIGDRWYPPGADGICDDGMSGMLMVVDTGHTIIDGVLLRTWTMDFCMANGDPWGWNHSVTERLGFYDGMPIPPGGCIVYEYSESLNCYTDTEISTNDQAWPFGCASVTGLPEEEQDAGTALFPNPGSDHFVLMLPNGLHDIALLDATGRCVLRERTSDPRPSINTAPLSPGLYHVRVDDGPPAKWIKE